MARRRYRKFRRSRGKWSSRLTNIVGTQTAAGGESYIIREVLAQNPAQSVDTISQRYTVKNVYAQVELESPVHFAIDNLQVYLMYIPQGFELDNAEFFANVPFQHPEWIMAHRYFGSAQFDPVSLISTSPESNYYPPLRLFSRLARKLDTGDKIVLIILGNNTRAESAELTYRGIVKMNTKAN